MGTPCRRCLSYARKEQVDHSRVEGHQSQRQGEVAEAASHAAILPHLCPLVGGGPPLPPPGGGGPIMPLPPMPAKLLNSLSVNGRAGT